MAMHATVRTAIGVVVLTAAAVSMSACSFGARNDGGGRGGTVPMTFERKAELGIITTEEAIGEDPALHQNYIGPVPGGDMVMDRAN